MLRPPRGQSVDPSMATPCAASCRSHSGSASFAIAKATCRGPLPSCGGIVPPGQPRGRQRGPAPEQQEDAAAPDRIGGQPVVPVDFGKAQNFLVKSARPGEVIDIEGGFKNRIERRHGPSRWRATGNLDLRQTARLFVIGLAFFGPAGNRTPLRSVWFLIGLRRRARDCGTGAQQGVGGGIFMLEHRFLARPDGLRPDYAAFARFKPRPGAT